MPSSSIQAVLFDMDGVLVDAREWHYEALNKALSLFGFGISRYDHLTTFDGLPTKEKLRQLSITDHLPVGLHSLINRAKQRYTREKIMESCNPIFHIEYTLSRLKREGYRLGVCTNSIRQTLDLMMDQSGLSPHLDVTLSNEDVTKAKPDPEIYTAAMARLGIDPAHCLIVEDNHHGLLAARASGAHVLQVADPSEVTFARLADAINRAGQAQ